MQYIGCKTTVQLQPLVQCAVSESIDHVFFTQNTKGHLHFVGHLSTLKVQSAIFQVKQTSEVVRQATVINVSKLTSITLHIDVKQMQFC